MINQPPKGVDNGILLGHSEGAKSFGLADFTLSNRRLQNGYFSIFTEGINGPKLQTRT